MGTVPRRHHGAAADEPLVGPCAHGRGRRGRPETAARPVPRARPGPPSLGGAAALAGGAARAAGDPAHARHDARGGAHARNAGALRRAHDLREPQDDHAGTGSRAARVRRGRQGRGGGPLRVGDVHRLGPLHRARRRRVPASRRGRVHRRDRRGWPPRDRGRDAVQDVGRDLRSHEAQPGRPDGPDGARRRAGPRALHMGAHAGQGSRLLHRVRTRPTHLEPAGIPAARRARCRLGRERGREAVVASAEDARGDLRGRLQRAELREPRSRLRSTRCRCLRKTR